MGKQILTTATYKVGSFLLSPFYMVVTKKCVQNFAPFQSKNFNHDNYCSILSHIERKLSQLDYIFHKFWLNLFVKILHRNGGYFKVTFLGSCSYLMSSLFIIFNFFNFTFFNFCIYFILWLLTGCKLYSE